MMSEKDKIPAYFDKDWDAEEKLFVEKVAKKVINGLSSEDKEYMIANPNPYEYHFSLGMMIRNKYIYGKELNFPVLMADNLSHEVIEKILSILKDSTNQETFEKDSDLNHE